MLSHICYHIFVAPGVTLSHNCLQTISWSWSSYQPPTHVDCLGTQFFKPCPHANAMSRGHKSWAVGLLWAHACACEHSCPKLYIFQFPPQAEKADTIQGGFIEMKDYVSYSTYSTYSTKKHVTSGFNNSELLWSKASSMALKAAIGNTSKKSIHHTFFPHKSVWLASTWWTGSIETEITSPIQVLPWVDFGWKWKTCWAFFLLTQAWFVNKFRLWFGR